jgi:hypothetical protein
MGYFEAMKVMKRPAAEVKLGRLSGIASAANMGGVPEGNTSKIGVSLGALRDFLKRYRISHDSVTRLTGFSLRAVTNWNQGSKPSASTSRRLNEMKRLFSALERLVSPDAIGEWLKEPNPAFDGSTPLQVIERGESDRIWRMVYELESGERS